MAVEDSYYIHLTTESLHTVWCFTLQLYWEGQYIAASTDNKDSYDNLNLLSPPFSFEIHSFSKGFHGLCIPGAEATLFLKWDLLSQAFPSKAEKQDCSAIEKLQLPKISGI